MEYDDKLTDEIIFGLKRCSECDVAKPKSSEYFRRDNSNEDGFDKMCKDCRLPASRAYDAGHREAKRAYDRTHGRGHHKRRRQKTPCLDWDEP